MRLLILGAGNVGLEVAARVRAAGGSVVATTTREERLPELRAVADEAVVLVGSDAEGVARAAEGCDAILMSASPPLMKSTTVEERRASYRDVLVTSCESAAAACDRVVFTSSISVFGDGRQEPGDLITEETPRTTSDEPSSVYFAMAEDAALSAPRGAVLRLADVYGHPRDIDFTSRVRLAHQYMGGSVAFARDGLLHRVHVEDVARGILHVLDDGLVGTYHLVPDLRRPPTNGEAFDSLADAAGLPRLEFRGELATPTKQVSSAKIRGTGFVFAHPADPLH
jgi:nucleoside-diphosphate-sugar epimerase